MAPGATRLPPKAWAVPHRNPARSVVLTLMVQGWIFSPKAAGLPQSAPLFAATLLCSCNVLRALLSKGTLKAVLMTHPSPLFQILKLDGRPLNLAVFTLV